MRGSPRPLVGVGACAAALLATWLGVAPVSPLTPAAAQSSAALVLVKLGLDSMSKTERATLWTRVEEYATVDALQEFCGKKLNLQRRTWKAVSPCIETSSLRKVAAVFRAKKERYLKAWEGTHGEPEKKKALCDGMQTKLAEYARIIDAHIAEADSLCRACLFC